MGAHRKEQGGSSILSASFSAVEVSFDAGRNGLSFWIKKPQWWQGAKGAGKLVPPRAGDGSRTINKQCAKAAEYQTRSAAVLTFPEMLRWMFRSLAPSCLCSRLLCPEARSVQRRPRSCRGAAPAAKMHPPAGQCGVAGGAERCTQPQVRLARGAVSRQQQEGGRSMVLVPGLNCHQWAPQLCFCDAGSC